MGYNQGFTKPRSLCHCVLNKLTFKHVQSEVGCSTLRCDLVILNTNQLEHDFARTRNNDEPAES